MYIFFESRLVWNGISKQKPGFISIKYIKKFQYLVTRFRDNGGVYGRKKNYDACHTFAHEERGEDFHRNGSVLFSRTIGFYDIRRKEWPQYKLNFIKEKDLNSVGYF